MIYQNQQAKQKNEWGISFLMLKILSPSGALGALGKVGAGSKWLNTAADFLRVTPKQAATISGVGNAAAWMSKEIGTGEKGEAIAKAGTMLAVPLIGARESRTTCKITG